jgi:hypothetical protein
VLATVLLLTQSGLVAAGGGGGTVGTGTSSGLPDPLAELLPYLNLGVFVVATILLITGKWIVPRWTLDRIQAEHDAKLEELKNAHEQAMKAEVARREIAERHEEEYKRLNSDLQTYQRDQLLPALMEATRIVTAYVQALSRRGGGLDT